jgi:O-antigen ligase/tetratricopeptide (TPR) repeat protein
VATPGGLIEAPKTRFEQLQRTSAMKDTVTPSSFGDWSRRSPQSVSDLLMWIVDTGLAAVLVFAPWFMGGRHPLGQLVLVSISVVVATAWAVRQTLSQSQVTWKISGSELLLLGAIALVVLQLTPLPSELLQTLSPHLGKLLPLWMPATQPPDALGSWNQLSLTPDATRAGLVMLLCYGLLFVVTLQRIETVEDVERLLRWFAVSAIVLATVGLLQYLTSNGKFLWVYQHPFRDTHDAVKGPFINKNHFAHLLALGLGPLIWSVQRALARVQAARDPKFGENALTSADLEWLVMVQCIGLGVVLFAGLMTLSRGGAIAMFAALAVSGGLLYRIGALSSRFILSFGLVSLFIGGALAIHGYQRVSDRLDDITAASVEELDNAGVRRKLWAADLAATRDFASLGTGVGSHRDVYRLYLPETWDVEMTHAENGYLQVAMESGIPGLTLLLIGIGLATYWCLEALRSTKNRRTYVAAIAVASGLAASVLHSWCDFVWYISSCMSATVLLLACACRLMEFSRGGRERWVWIHWNISRPSLAMAVAIIVLVGGWMVTNRFCAAAAAPHWDQYLSFIGSAENAEGTAIPGEELLNDLRAAVQWAPDDSRAHAALARMALRRFEEIQKSSPNPMPISQIRDAAMRSRFASRQKLDEWLSNAFGDHRRYLEEALWHTRLALVNCPLHGDAYLYLSELCFLENAHPETKDAYIQQALEVRPYDGDVLISAGREKALVGAWPQALEYWKRAFQCGPTQQKVLISVASSAGIGPQDFVEIFRPGWPEIRMVYEAYAPLAGHQELGQLRNVYLSAAETALGKMKQATAAVALYEMYGTFKRVGPPEQALAMLQQAVKANPNQPMYRRDLALELKNAGQYAAAEKELNWCLQRYPENRELRDALAEVVRKRVADDSRSALRHDSQRQ